MKSRIPLPDPDTLSPAQREIHDSILRTRGNLDGPFLAWLHSPELARHAEKLGAFCRYGSCLSLVESELLILCVAAQFDCIGEQQIHEPIAKKAGLSEETVTALRERRLPALDDPRLRLLHQISRELLSTHRIADATFAAARDVLGEKALVEIAGILGYYAFVALTLNAFDMRAE